MLPCYRHHRRAERVASEERETARVEPERKVEWKDLVAISLVVLMFLSVPLLALLVVVSIWGLATAVRDALEDPRAMPYVALWTIVAISSSAALWYAVRWHRR